jgi:hypothetical protein
MPDAQAARLLRLHSAQAVVAPCQKSPPENYGKEDQTTVAAFLPWRDL